MPYFAVSSGDMMRCVLADDELTACVHAVTKEIADFESDLMRDNPPLFGSLFHTAELGQSAYKNIYVLAQIVMEAGGWTYEKTTEDEHEK